MHWVSAVVRWSSEYHLVSWGADYRADYYPSGQYYVVNNHYSGGCIWPKPFPQSVINKLDYYRSNSFYKRIYFDQNESSMCASPKIPYGYAKYGDNVIYNPNTQSLKVDVITVWFTSNPWVEPDTVARNFWVYW